MDDLSWFRLLRVGYGKIVGFWPYEIRENPLGYASIPPGIYPGFHRMQRIRFGGFQPPGQKHKTGKRKRCRN